MPTECSSHFPSRCSCCLRPLTPGATKLDKHTGHHGDRFLVLFQLQGLIPCSLREITAAPGSLPLPPAQDRVHTATSPAGEAGDTFILPEASSLAAASQTQEDETAAGHPLARAGTGERSALAPEKGEHKGSARGFRSSAEQLSAPPVAFFHSAWVSGGHQKRPPHAI